MSINIYQRIQTSLDKKRQNVTEFLETAPDTEKAICLCNDETCVDAHLHVIEESL